MNSLMVTVAVSPTPGAAGSPRGPHGGTGSGAGDAFGEALEAATPAPAASGGKAAGTATDAAGGKGALPDGKILPPEHADTAGPGAGSGGLPASLPGAPAPSGPEIGVAGATAETVVAAAAPLEADMASATVAAPRDADGRPAAGAAATAGTPAPAAGDEPVPGAVPGRPDVLSAQSATQAVPQAPVPPTSPDRSVSAAPPETPVRAGAAVSGAATAPALAATTAAVSPAGPEVALPDAAAPVARAVTGALQDPTPPAPVAREAAEQFQAAPRAPAGEAVRPDPATLVRDRLLADGARMAAEPAADAVEGPAGRPGGAVTAAQATPAFSLPAAVDPLSPAATRAPGVAAAALSPPDPGFDVDLAGQVRLMVRDGQSEARLQLNPPELGRLDIRIATDGDQARVLFTVQGADARDAIEQALPRLRELLEQGGLQLSRFDVSDQSRQRQGEARASLSSEHLEPGAEEGVAPPTDLPGRPRASHALVDFYV